MRDVSSALMTLLRKSTTHRFRAQIVLLCALCFLAVLPLSASSLPINGVGGFIYDTGVNNAGVTIGSGGQDPHWICNGPNCSGQTFQAQTSAPANFPSPGNTNWPLPATQNTDPGTGPWVASAISSGLAVSQWDTFNQPNVFIDTDATQEFDVQQSFNLTNFLFASLELQGSVAFDNTSFGIQINGKAVTGTTSGNYGTSSSKTTFDITNASCAGGCFQAGTNVIIFRALNLQSGSPNPTGILVEFSSATATPTGVPEPATLFGVGLGLSILGLVYRRRRS